MATLCNLRKLELRRPVRRRLLRPLARRTHPLDATRATADERTRPSIIGNSALGERRRRTSEWLTATAAAAADVARETSARVALCPRNLSAAPEAIVRACPSKSTPPPLAPRRRGAQIEFAYQLHGPQVPATTCCCRQPKPKPKHSLLRLQLQRAARNTLVRGDRSVVLLSLALPAAARLKPSSTFNGAGSGSRNSIRCERLFLTRRRRRRPNSVIIVLALMMQHKQRFFGDAREMFLSRVENLRTYTHVASFASQWFSRGAPLIAPSSSRWRRTIRFARTQLPRRRR